MSAATPYLLPRNEYEKKRLNLQHTVIIRHFGGCLPSSVKPGPNAKILDTGCGTGIWSIDLAATLPKTVTFQSCDISGDNFLNKSEETPSNINFGTHSVLSFPKEWENTFDVIHQRLLQGGITIAEWKLALKELYRVTKPGGHVVLVEIDHANFTGELADPVPAGVEINSKYWQAGYKHNDRLWEPRPTIPKFLEEVGFEAIEVEDMIFPIEGAVTTVVPQNDGRETSLADDTLDCMLRVFQSFKQQVVALNLVSAERYDALLAEWAVGWKDVPKTEKGRGFPWFRVCARKPLA
jgi:ubiquinone/menaquinone biosynthesis C-methylase UbiE